VTRGPDTTLAVHLDGALLRSDPLFESFWAAAARDWRAALVAMGRAPRAGRSAAFDRIGPVDVATLPYDADLIERLRAHKTAGGRIVLLAGPDAALARRIAGHLDLFDEVRDDRFADLQAEILAGSNAPPALRDYLRALRPHQWLKNLLVFLPMLTAHAFGWEAFLASFLAFVAFSMVASSVYLLNDLLDLAADRAHPRKRARPFAAGDIPIGRGTVLAGGLLLGGFVIAALIAPLFLLVMALYYAITLAYSMDLKRRTVIDICVLAGLYTIRIVAGGAATGIPLSVWLLAFSIFLFFALAAVKRQAELVDNLRRGELAVSGRGYIVDDIPVVQAMAIGSGYVSVLVMALFVNAPSTVANYSTPEALWGICCVLLYWITRTVFLAHRGYMDDDPVVYAAKDNISRLCLVLILGFAGLGMVL